MREINEAEEAELVELSTDESEDAQTMTPLHYERERGNGIDRDPSEGRDATTAKPKFDKRSMFWGAFISLVMTGVTVFGSGIWVVSRLEVKIEKLEEKINATPSNGEFTAQLDGINKRLDAVVKESRDGVSADTTQQTKIETLAVDLANKRKEDDARYAQLLKGQDQIFSSVAIISTNVGTLKIEMLKELAQVNNRLTRLEK